jgi:hypothetical protein
MAKIQLKVALKEIYNGLEPELPEELLRRAVLLCKDDIAELIGSLIMDTREQESKLLSLTSQKKKASYQT